MATTRTTNNHQAKNGGPYPAISGHKESAMRSFAERVGGDREAIERLNADLHHARNENSQLVAALRSLHSQFNSLQMHADKQSELLLCGGEELQDAKLRLVALQRELERSGKEYEQVQSRGGPDQAKDLDTIEKSNAALRARLGELENYVESHKSEWTQSDRRLRDYHDALAGMEQEISDWKAAAEKQERDNAELAVKIVSLERRCAELDGRRAERESAYDELRSTFDGRNDEIERLNKNVSRMQEEFARIFEEIGQETADVQRSVDDRPIVGDTVVTLPAIDEAYAKSRNGNAVKPWWYSEENADAEQWAAGAQQKPETGRKSNGKDSSLQRYIVMPIGGKKNVSHYPLDKKIVTIGRSRGNDIPVVSGCVSRVHARIIQTGSRVIIEDMGSRNGLLVNSRPKRYQALRHGDTFTIGSSEFELFDAEASGHAQPATADA